MLMEVYKLYVPTEVPIDARNSMEFMLSENFTGWTKYYATGSWCNVKEEIVVYEVATAQDGAEKKIKGIMRLLLAFNQEEAFYTKTISYGISMGKGD